MIEEVKSYFSFEDAERDERLERWSLSGLERLEILEKLRSYQYPDGKTAPRLQRVLETLELSSS